MAVVNKIDYFWETEYKFGEFLKSIFDTYKRKYSLAGNGIFNLVTVNNQLYEIKYTQAKSKLTSDNHAIDTNKKIIIDTITSNLKTKDFTISGGKFITFPVNSWIAKVEIIKKLKMPE